MDHLFYDLVEGIMNFLPREDVETIAKVAKKSQELKNWNIAAEDQLEKRVLLDVKVFMCNYHYLGRRLSHRVWKILPNGNKEDWDYSEWRYAWIRNVDIGGADELRRCCFWTECFGPGPPLDKVLRVLSLPVDPSARGSLAFSDTSKHREVNDHVLKCLLATHKEFVTVKIRQKYKDTAVIDNLIVDYIDRGGFLEEVDYSDGGTERRKICEAIVPLFGRIRGRPLEIHLMNVPFAKEDIEQIMENWMKSDGTYECKELSCSSLRNPWNIAKTKYKQFVGDEETGYVAHPTKNSSLCVTKKSISIEDFQPWHVRVALKWVDSVISKWKKGDGHYVYKEKTDSSGLDELSFTFEAKEDWLKLERKYGTRRGGSTRATRTNCDLSIAHPSRPVSLKVSKFDERCEVRVVYKK